MNKFEFVVTADGIIRRNISEDILNIDDKVLASLSSAMFVPCYNLLSAPDYVHRINGSFAPQGGAVITVWLKYIVLRARMRAITNSKMVTPSFFEKEGQPLEVIWMPPSSMALMFMVTAGKRTSGYRADACHLCAFVYGTSPSQRIIYRLPLPNVFEDGSICMGQYDNNGVSLQEVVSKALTQFRKSEWNGDLLNNDTEKKCERLFRFNPTNEGFDVRHDYVWTDECFKISTEVINKRLVI